MPINADFESNLGNNHDGCLNNCPGCPVIAMINRGDPSRIDLIDNTNGGDEQSNGEVRVFQTVRNPDQLPFRL